MAASQTTGCSITYGELFDVFEEIEGEPDAANLLAAKLCECYPDMIVGRPGRLLDTVGRLIAPTRASTVGPAKLSGSPLRHYRKRFWEPRIRIASKKNSSDVYPPELTKEGLTQKIFLTTLHQVKAGSTDLSWKLRTIPTVGFYRCLHTYLQQQSLSKVLIGRFYLAIDCMIEEKGSRADNTYRFINNIVLSARESSSPMIYNISVVQSTSTMLRRCTEEIEGLNMKCSELHDEVVKLRACRRENKQLKQKLKDVQLEKECDQLLKELDEEDLNDSDSSFDEPADTIQDIIGHNKYTPEIRTLYYSLLSNQVPASKIAGIVKEVLKCFNPDMSPEAIEKLRLPEKSCASYMRKEELRTINDAHKAHLLCEAAEKGTVSLNTDGTTKNQRKIGGAIVDGAVLCVNELADGKALTAIEDITREFEKLRHVAEILKIPNAQHINWTLVKSSSSDSAATQKCLNRLIQEKRQSDEEKFGPQKCTAEMLDLIETSCSMHLGVNLRKAFLEGTSAEQNERQHRVDSFVHQFCKLFGRTGGPEYACGVVLFPDFLDLKSSSEEGDDSEYYLECSKIKLNRQIGNRYFVTAANAAKILFLIPAAIEFLKFTGKDKSGNKLEQEVFSKLNDSHELNHLRADALMYYHIYGDLCMLAKSTHLGKSVYCMNQHYLELLNYLSDVETSPHIVFDQTHQVFLSEKRLYGADSKVNFRLSSPLVYERLFQIEECDTVYLNELLVSGASSMKEKLLTYSKDQLPGGCYWNPENSVKEVLQQLSPSNDACESIFGLNDYLTTAIPNLHQLARSNLVQTKKNKSLKWLSSLEKKDQHAIIGLAMERRKSVARECKEEEHERAERRRQKMVQENTKRLAREKKSQDEREKLSQEHLITSSEELLDELQCADEELNASTRKKRKLHILKTQVQIRKKVLLEKVPIVFTSNRKERPLNLIAQELCDYIDSNPLPEHCATFIRNPRLLIGRRVKQRFLDGQDMCTSTWYCGTVKDYSPKEKMHSLEYDGEKEIYNFDLAIDLLLGDIIIID